MAKFLSDGLGWLKRSISEHESVVDNTAEEEEEPAGAAAVAPRGNRLPHQRSLDLPRFGFFPEEDEEEDMVDGNSPTKGDRKTTRSVSEGGLPPLIRPPTDGEKEVRKDNNVFEESFELEVNGTSTLMTLAEMTGLSEHLPPRLVGSPWNLLTSTERDGFSLKNIYRRMEGKSGPALLVIKDKNEAVFGALSSHPFRISESYYGTGETFLFRLRPTPLRVFKWTTRNEMFVSCSASTLTVGAGNGIFGLSLDSDLDKGRSRRCETFDNEELSAEGDFVVTSVEVWTFGT